MEIGLAKLRILFSVIVLIAASVAAGAVFAGQSPGAGTNVSCAIDPIPSLRSPHQVAGDVVMTDWRSHDGGCQRDCSIGCVHSTGSGCCSTSLVAVECRIPFGAPDTVCVTAGKAILATGIDPEAVLQPPQILA